MLIGKLAAKSGFSRDTIRYYEKLGLIEVDAADGLTNNYKNYPQRALDRLTQISELKTLGFTLTEIAPLIASFEQNEQPCSELPAQIDEKIAGIDVKIGLLSQYKHKLEAVREACGSGCGSKVGLPECFNPEAGYVVRIE